MVAFTYMKGHEDKDKDDTLKMLLEAKTGGAQDPLAIAADIGYEENCKQVIELVVKEYGRIDVLVNNAAEQHLTNSPEEITEHQLLRVFRTNIFSHFFLVRHALKHMKEGSSIINSTSVNPYSGNPESLDYTATKGAIVAFTRGLSQQLENQAFRFLFNNMHDSLKFQITSQALRQQKSSLDQEMELTAIALQRQSPGAIQSLKVKTQNSNSSSSGAAFKATTLDNIHLKQSSVDDYIQKVVVAKGKCTKGGVADVDAAARISTTGMKLCVYGGSTLANKSSDQKKVNMLIRNEGFDRA
ncbi:hypothetical protein RIF29_14383 [Crotalaria pallida]|uniref:Uncharacterized protein n=1 Tax=Crotalaria pallida TaxID=3830 RepID=A0AAN9FD78_CROPI